MALRLVISKGNEMCIMSFSRGAAVSVALCIVSATAADPPCFRGLGVQLQYSMEVTVTGMSADGTTIVGYVQNQDGGWRWVAPDGFQSCPGTPGGLWAALGISGDGLSIVGSMVYDYPTSRRPMRWTAGVGGMWLTALPDSPEGQANAVSADGLTIVGHAGLPTQY
jgi:uncharacterized membrane protein